MSNPAVLARRLSELLGLTAAPVAVSFDAPPGADTATPVPAQPAGCCFWAPAQQRRLDTVGADHANCSIGSYTHGLIPLEQAASGADTAALVGSGWVGEADLMGAAALPFRPSSITYQPLVDAENPDVVLARLSPTALMTLLGAVPDLILARKPQCVIVPLAQAGQVAVSPGCAVSRTRTNLPEDELTCAIPARELESLIESLETSTAAERAVSEFAAADMERKPCQTDTAPGRVIRDRQDSGGQGRNEDAAGLEEIEGFGGIATADHLQDNIDVGDVSVHDRHRRAGGADQLVTTGHAGSRRASAQSGAYILARRCRRDR